MLDRLLEKKPQEPRGSFFLASEEKEPSEFEKYEESLEEQIRSLSDSERLNYNPLESHPLFLLTNGELPLWAQSFGEKGVSYKKIFYQKKGSVVQFPGKELCEREIIEDISGNPCLVERRYNSEGELQNVLTIMSCDFQGGLLDSGLYYVYNHRFGVDKSPTQRFIRNFKSLEGLVLSLSPIFIEPQPKLAVTEETVWKPGNDTNMNIIKLAAQSSHRVVWECVYGQIVVFLKRKEGEPFMTHLNETNIRTLIFLYPQEGTENNLFWEKIQRVLGEKCFKGLDVGIKTGGFLVLGKDELLDGLDELKNDFFGEEKPLMGILL